ncbi:Na+/H+ antiporter [Robbsia andropogonis]|uniref:Na+/H+ antiporter n=1 Tax=Robbsia andropogonis TaxID=28092 RepID=UPI002A6AEF92|nr:Na+/H+ antiporter [Robbsia andropogonis]
MSSVSAFEIVLLSLVAMVALQLLARQCNLPPAVALLAGGIGMAFVPGLPPINLDPDLVLVVILPPLLMYGGYFTVWDDLKRNFGGVMMLAVGAVTFTTLTVGWAAHWLVPGLPWAVCFALGAIVSPPDAVAAKAILARLTLPRRLMVLLEGESLLNDAAGLTLFRFALAAALTGSFSMREASMKFGELAVGGMLIGLLCGWLLLRAWRYIKDDYLVMVTSLLVSWGSYIIGEKLGVSGVIAAVCCGLVIGRNQHGVFSAAARLRATSFWQSMVFIFEALVFILIGLSLHGVMQRVAHGTDHEAWYRLGMTSGGIVIVVIVSRFAWIFGVEAMKVILEFLRMRVLRRPPISEHSFASPDWRAATVMSWAGMRGVVTIAIALSLPENLPGRDLILVCAFAVILATVIVQGVTIGVLIQWLLPPRTHTRESRYMSEPQAWAYIHEAQFAAIEPLVHDADGQLIHPRLYEQYQYRANLAKRHSDQEAFPREALEAHYGIVLAAIASGRQTLLKLHDEGRIHDELMHALEHDLDLQEMSTRHQRDG